MRRAGRGHQQVARSLRRRRARRSRASTASASVTSADAAAVPGPTAAPPASRRAWSRAISETRAPRAARTRAVAKPDALRPAGDDRVGVTDAHAEILPPARRRASDRYFGAIMSSGLHRGVELLGGEVAGGDRRLAQRRLLLVRLLGDLAGLVVADHRVERGDDHQRVARRTRRSARGSARGPRCRTRGSCCTRR